MTGSAVARPIFRSLTVRVVLVLAPPLLLAVAWVGGLVWYAAAIPVPETDAAGRRADAIVVLTGGSERLRAGLELLERGLGGVLFISGVPAAVAPDDLWRALARAPSPAVAGRVELGHAAADTLGNAEETAAWVRRHGVRTVRLVTAAYHMRRALLEFRPLMPEVRLIPHPVYPPHVKQEEWWRFPGTASLLASEYSKYLVAWLRLNLGLSLRARAPATVESS
ncbi:YdcF family protein [Roseospira goensis]|uniref:Uncharacterized SAM-binding protein YcdF (DUF218 family) n=1 Tax=Roseospira goensis TaxID=391922 RepID=A0A7W6RZB6_9PROT|nr:YdcF family protein [Roseospira goensis]MBB4286011.1 uncharacterized SAM-binding protein YcdF (DUF218 family) [Roseospira goensis]